MALNLLFVSSEQFNIFISHSFRSTFEEKGVTHQKSIAIFFEWIYGLAENLEETQIKSRNSERKRRSTLGNSNENNHIWFLRWIFCVQCNLYSMRRVFQGSLWFCGIWIHNDGDGEIKYSSETFETFTIVFPSIGCPQQH